MEEIYPGAYRGVVENNADPEKRKRYQVRVFALHPEGVPVEALPWAESSLFAGKMFGDLPSFEKGDPVFVMFEGGNRRFPVLIGGMLTASAGIPDAPSEIRADYNETQSKWLRVDRVGNKIEMSPLPEERWLLLQSGDAVIRLRMNSGSIELVSNTSVAVTAPQVSVEASEQVTVATKNLIAQVDDVATIRSAGTVNVTAADAVNIGRYEDPLLGPLNPKTTDVVDVRANQNVKIESGGTLDVDATNNATIDSQANVEINAQTEIKIHGVSKTTVTSDGDLIVQADGKVTVDGTGDVEVKSAQKVLVNAATTVEIKGSQGVTINAQAGDIAIKADAGNVAIEALGNLTVKASSAQTIESTGPLTLKSTSQVKIEAPIVEIAATVTAKLDGGSLAEIKGGLVNIG